MSQCCFVLENFWQVINWRNCSQGWLFRWRFERQNSRTPSQAQNKHQCMYIYMYACIYIRNSIYISDDQTCFLCFFVIYFYCIWLFGLPSCCVLFSGETKTKWKRIPRQTARTTRTHSHTHTLIHTQKIKVWSYNNSYNNNKRHSGSAFIYILTVLVCECAIVCVSECVCVCACNMYFFTLNEAPNAQGPTTSTTTINTKQTTTSQLALEIKLF